MAGLIAWLNAGNVLGIIIWVSIIVLSVLVHEYGHAITAVAFHQRAAIDLVIYGGLTKRSGKQLKRWQEFIIVFNGPLAGALLGLIAYGILHFFEPHLNAISIYALTVTWTINLFWTIVNLLPVFPLDGGQLLTISLQAFFGLNGLRGALLISTLIALLVSIFFFSLSGGILAGAIFLMLTFESYRNWRSSMAMTPTDQSPVVQHQLHLAEMFIREGNIEGSEKILEDLISSTPDGMVHNSAVMTLAKLRFQQGKFSEVVNLLKPLVGKLDGPHLELLILAALQDNDLLTIQNFGNRAYQEYPTYNIALANARCYARLNQPIPAIGWLQSAIRDGIPDAKTIAGLKDFDGLRQTDAWKKIESLIQ